MTVHTPIETRSGGLPPWAILLTLLVFLVGGVYLAANLVGENPPLAIPGESAAPAPGDGEPDPAVGEALVGQATPQCASCHGADFAGSGPFPSLRGVSEGAVSENLQDFAAEHPDNWAELWIAGAPEADGSDRLGMPAYGDQFSEEQLASIVAYLKSLD
jgi:mono/diheme cytochrome c family protein